jgi:CRP-like cAMP-binding protein
MVDYAMATKYKQAAISMKNANIEFVKPEYFQRIAALGQLDQEQLTAFLSYVELIHCEPLRLVFKQGAPGDSMFLILEGQVRVYTETSQGRSIFLRPLEAGASFGEVALINHIPRTASVEAVKPSILLSLSSASLQRMIAEQPALAAKILHHLAGTLGRQLGDLTTRLRSFWDQEGVSDSV